MMSDKKARNTAVALDVLLAFDFEADDNEIGQGNPCESSPDSEGEC